jgi:hypothetical protein
MPSIFARHTAPYLGIFDVFFFFDPEFQSTIITYKNLLPSYRENTRMLTTYEVFTSFVRSEYPAHLMFDLIAFIAFRE